MRNGRFEVGDVCVWQRLVGTYAHFNGAETVVTGEFKLRRNQKGTVLECYLTSTVVENGVCAGAKHENLRLKNPPSPFWGEEQVMQLFRERETTR